MSENIMIRPRSERRKLAKIMRVPFSPVPSYAGFGKTVKVQYVKSDKGIMRQLSYKPVDAAHLVEV